MSPSIGLAHHAHLGYLPCHLVAGRLSFLSLISFSTGTEMATLQTTIPDDLSRQVRSIARARGIPVHLLVEEALRCIVSPEPFASESEALTEMEALESDVLKDLPWEK
jgi:hypothetical protein